MAVTITVNGSTTALGDETTPLRALSIAPGSGVAFSVAICVIWPVAALLTYHVRVRPSA